MTEGYEYAYSNYRSYVRPAEDGLSAWHPAYLRLGQTLDHCARRPRSVLPPSSITRKESLPFALGRLATVV